MTLLIKSPVWEDLAHISARIAIDNPDAAGRFLDSAEKTFELLREFPHLGRLRNFSMGGIRSWHLHGFNQYLVFYISRSGEVVIIAVLHGAMDLEAALGSRLSCP
jgi:plasmid stabilization system protein ParE